MGWAAEALSSRYEAETPHEHVAGDVGGSETTPAPAVRSPVVDHGVRWDLRDDPGVRGHQPVVNIELDSSPCPHALVRVEAFLGGEGACVRVYCFLCRPAQVVHESVPGFCPSISGLSISVCELFTNTKPELIWPETATPDPVGVLEVEEARMTHS